MKLEMKYDMSQLDLLKLGFSKMDKLLVYRQIIDNSMFVRIRSLVMSLDNSDEHINAYYQICYELISIAEQDGFQGDLLQNYFIKLIATDENYFSLACEKGFKLSLSLSQLAIHDLNILKDILKFTLTDIGTILGVEELSFISHYSTDNIQKNRNPLQNNFKLLKQSFVKEKVDHIVKKLADYYLSLIHI